MYQPDQGRIEVDGTPLTALDPEAWRARCTAAFQDFSRFNLAAVESVGVADLAGLDDEPAALAALDRAGAGDLPGQLPDGPGHLRRQRVHRRHRPVRRPVAEAGPGPGDARRRPAAGGAGRADRQPGRPAEHALFERYTAAARDGAAAGTVTVLVSHRFSTVRMADLIIYLEEGRAVEIGTHDELLAAGGRYAELFSLQADAYR